MNVSNWKTALCASGSAVLCGMAYKMFKITKSNERQCDTSINEVLFYGSKDENEMKKNGLNNLFCIYYLIIHANRSIDVCVPSLVSDTITKCLINVQRNNMVKIKVAIHNSENLYNIASFTQYGIEVKVIDSDEPLEHEFILIDASEDFDDAVAVIGSLDYETGRINCNNDITLLTSEAAVVKALKKEFDRVWNSATDKEMMTKMIQSV